MGYFAIDLDTTSFFGNGHACIDTERTSDLLFGSARRSGLRVGLGPWKHRLGQKDQELEQSAPSTKHQQATDHSNSIPSRVGLGPSKPQLGQRDQELEQSAPATKHQHNKPAQPHHATTPARRHCSKEVYRARHHNDMCNCLL